MSASQQLRTTTLLIQQQSSDNYLGLNLGKGRGRGRYAVAQMLTCHWSKLFMAAQNIIGCDFTVKISLIPYNRDRNFYLLSHSSPPLPPPHSKNTFGSSSFTIKVVVERIFIFFLLRKRRRGSKLEKEIEILNPNQCLGQNSNADITEAINLQLHTVPLHRVKSHQPKQMHWIFSPKEETIKRYWRLFPTFW